ncbi:exodeoxyribonuclease VII small subunit [Spiroplasma endosymbiont of Othius punctulatus]|uniref:exodeoxyribonuclease VII small subunit n=1 Tax=Spiroplasma endosymbiont of Othius punctulatus TaxID=3066289 RepID=UPI0030CC29A7
MNEINLKIEKIKELIQLIDNPKIELNDSIKHYEDVKKLINEVTTDLKIIEGEVKKIVNGEKIEFYKSNK